MESILDKTDNQLINLEKLVSDIEFGQIETKVLEGLQTGNESLKQLHSILSIENIEQIMDDTKEGIEKQRVTLDGHHRYLTCTLIWFVDQEIDDLLMGLNIETDDDGLAQELEQMLSQTLPDLPEVPQNERKIVYFVYQ